MLCSNIIYSLFLCLKNSCLLHDGYNLITKQADDLDFSHSYMNEGNVCEVKSSENAGASWPTKHTAVISVAYSILNYRPEACCVNLPCFPVPGKKQTDFVYR